MAQEVTGMPQEQPDQVRFHYLKSDFFRVLHVDGVHGGISPRGQIQMAVFNERLPIPQQSVYKLVDGGLGEEISDERIQKEGIIREVEAELLMSVDTARSLVAWLKEKIELIEKLEAGKRGEERDHP